MATDDGSCCIIEVMGRAAGWIAAGTMLQQPNDPPHIILLPEIAFDEAKFLARVKEVVDTCGCCVGGGRSLKDAEGNVTGVDNQARCLGASRFGRAADRLAEIVEPALTSRPARCARVRQRAAAHYASREGRAFTCGTVPPPCRARAATW